MIMSLQWFHDERDGVSNHRCLDCLLNRLFRRISKKISKLRVTGLCYGNSPATGEFHAQRASNAECFHLMTSSYLQRTSACAVLARKIASWMLMTRHPAMVSVRRDRMDLTIITTIKTTRMVGIALTGLCRSFDLRVSLQWYPISGMSSQTTGISIVCWTTCSGWQERKYPAP